MITFALDLTHGITQWDYKKALHEMINSEGSKDSTQRFMVIKTSFPPFAQALINTYIFVKIRSRKLEGVEKGGSRCQSHVITATNHNTVTHCDVTDTSFITLSEWRWLYLGSSFFMP